jgi:non-ribosomal peptide synthetase component F
MAIKHGALCLQVLLHKYTQQDDIVVGTPYANREVSEVNDVLGAFLNTLALRLDLGGDPSFAKLLGRAKATAVQAFAHGSTPFAKVVEALGVFRSAAFTPIYQVPSHLLHGRRVCLLRVVCMTSTVRILRWRV